MTIHATTACASSQISLSFAGEFPMTYASSSHDGSGMRGTADDHAEWRLQEVANRPLKPPTVDTFSDAPGNLRQRRRGASDIAGPLAVLLLFLAGWYLLAYMLDNNFAPNGKALILPPPHQLFEDYQITGCDAHPKPAACVNQQQIWQAVKVTTTTAIIGLGIAIILGVALAVAMSWKDWVEKSLWPYLIALQAIPIVAVTPLMIKVIGANLQARVFVTVMISIFPIVSNTLFGLLSADRNQHDLFLLNRAKWGTRLLKLQLPNALPAIFTGFRTSAGLAVVGSIVGDFFFTRGTTGLGRSITDYFLNNQGGLMVVCAMFSALLGISFFVIFGILNRITTSKWYQPTGRTR
jgi:NitT/TauT family transport system permease protein